MQRVRQIFLIVLTPSIAAYAQLQTGVLTYNTISGKSVSISTCTIQNDRDSVKLTLEWSTGKQRFHSEVTTDSALSTTHWKYSNKIEGSEVVAVRKKDIVFLNGIYKEKPITKKFAVDGMYWKEAFPYDLTAFAQSKSKRLKFFGLGLEGPSAMILGTFIATKTGIETITVNAKKIEATHVRVSLLGMGAIFWHGDYWFRRSDGCPVRVTSLTRGADPIISDLISEK